MQFIDLKSQYQRIKASIDKHIHQVLEHGQYIMGPEIQQLEERLAHYAGVKHCITVANGTDALLIAMMALGIGNGDEVITTPFTFIASVETIALLGARPVFVDINPKTYNIDATQIEEVITPKTKAIMPVNLFGQCADFDLINDIGNRQGIPVIEDGAQSFGATYKGKQSCSLSTIGATSFFPSKPLGCYGDAGACFTNDNELAKVMREIRNHGQDRRYHHPRIGMNGRMDTIQAAILLAKLEVFDDELKNRFQIGAKYSELFNHKVVTPYIEPFNTSIYAQYTIQINQRDKIQQKLNAEGIPTAVHYPIPVSLQPAFAYLNYVQGSFPIAEETAKNVLSLPMHAYLSNEQQLAIINKVLQFCNE